jgi:hypothetical protein
MTSAGKCRGAIFTGPGSSRGPSRGMISPRPDHTLISALHELLSIVGRPTGMNLAPICPVRPPPADGRNGGRRGCARLSNLTDPRRDSVGHSGWPLPRSRTRCPMRGNARVLSSPLSPSSNERPIPTGRSSLLTRRWRKKGFEPSVPPMRNRTSGSRGEATPKNNSGRIRLPIHWCGGRQTSHLEPFLLRHLRLQIRRRG